MDTSVKSKIISIISWCRPSSAALPTMVDSIADHRRHQKTLNFVVINFPNIVIILCLLRQTVYFCGEIKSDFLWDVQ